MSLLLKNSTSELTTVLVVSGETVELEGIDYYFSGCKITIGNQVTYVGNEFEITELNGAVRFDWVDVFNEITKKSITVFLNRTIFSTIQELEDYVDLARNPTAGQNIASDKNYVHNQGTASMVWTVNHNLAKYPSVTVVDSAKNEWTGAVQHIDTNTLTISFTNAFSGQAYIN